MTSDEVLTGARTMWELVERRAEASPDHPMLIAADGETAHLRRLPRPGRAGGRRPAGIGRGHRLGGVVAAPDPDRHRRALAGPLPARGGPEPDHPPLPRTGGGLRPAADRRLPLRHPPRVAGHRLPGPGRAGPGRRPVAPGDPDHRRRAARGRPGHAAPAPAGTAPEEAPIRWIYYTSGSTADPKGVQHTDQTLIAGGWGLAHALEMTPDDVGSIAFPFAHIAGPDYLVTMLSLGFPAVLVEAFSAPDVLPLFRRHGATMVGGSTAFYVAYLAEQRKDPGDADPAHPAPHVRRRGGQAARDPLRGARRDRRPGRRARLRHDRGPDDRQRLPHRHRRAAGQHRRQAGRGGRGAHRHARRAAGRARRGGRGPRAGPDGLPRLHRPRAHRRRLRRRRVLPHRGPGQCCGPTGISP